MKKKRKSLVYCTQCKYQVRDCDMLEPISLDCKRGYKAIYDTKECKRFKRMKEV